ncbi:MAG TPA: winged helix-turn-helix transcriptional regulator [Nanoarchaeota archaeon]|nr:winged helix-turn-helix transcriptional regulator [Nanoarchaeota archaeon]
MNLTLEELGILSSYTRRKILKVLAEKRQNVTGLSEIMGRSKSTMHEQLIKLYQKGFVTRIEREGHKDVYYELSEKGSSLMRSEPAVITMAAVSMIAGISGVYSLVKYFAAPALFAASALKANTLPDEAAPVLMAAPESARAAAVPGLSRISAGSVWLFAGLLLIVIAALVLYSMFRKRKHNP